MKDGMVIETNEGSWRTVVFGWGATTLGIGVAVACIVLSAQLGLAVTLVGGGFGLALAAVGVGEGVRRVLLGKAAEKTAQAQLTEAKARLMYERQRYLR